MKGSQILCDSKSLEYNVLFCVTQKNMATVRVLYLALCLMVQSNELSELCL